MYCQLCRETVLVALQLSELCPQLLNFVLQVSDDTILQLRAVDHAFKQQRKALVLHLCGEPCAVHVIFRVFNSAVKASDDSLTFAYHDGPMLFDCSWSSTAFRVSSV